MINDRTIGNHENNPKISSIGNRKASVLSPSLLTRIRGRRRVRSPTAATVRTAGELMPERVPFCASSAAL
jgi:hypothetical protein